MSLNVGKAALALGALLAYKNKDKIADMFSGNRDPNAPQTAGGGGLLDGILGGAGGGGALQDILDRFRGAGSGDAVDSWVGTQPNKPLAPEHVESAIDAETLDQLSAQTGLSRKELIDRITRDLPEAVNDLTPDGKLPQVKAGAPKDGELLDNFTITPATQA